MTRKTHVGILVFDDVEVLDTPGHTAGHISYVIPAAAVAFVGDTVFALATGQWTGEADVTQIGALAAEVMARAIVRAATEATGLPNLPAARDLKASKP